MDALANALIIFSILAFIAFLIWNRTRGALERRRLELDAQSKMLDKIGPGQALTSFLTTLEGQRFLDRLTAPEPAPDRSRDAHRRVLVLVVLGLIALFAGVFFVMAVLMPQLLSGDPAGARLVPFVPVFVLTGAGAGALVGAWIMHRYLKKWGMLEPRTLGDPAG
jgi:hypothetical protein